MHGGQPNHGLGQAAGETVVPKHPNGAILYMETSHCVASGKRDEDGGRRRQLEGGHEMTAYQFLSDTVEERPRRGNDDTRVSEYVLFQGRP